MKSVAPLFDAIIEYIPAPHIGEGPMQMLVVNVAYDSYKGQIAIGPLVSGSLKKGQSVARIEAEGTIKPAKLTSVMTFDGLSRVETDNALPGDIVAVAGIESVKIGETIADAENPQQLPVIMIDEPTVKMSFAVNTSPLSGTEGEFSTSRHLKARLMREVLADVALKVKANSASDASFTVFGRGELHVAILIEKMLREGYEFEVGKPQVIFKEENGKKLEPFEDVFIECPDKMAGTVIEKMGKRKGEMKDMKVEKGLAKMHFLLTTRGLIGYRSEFLTDTRGEGIINTLFKGYLAYLGDIEIQQHGSLVAHEAGVSTHYGLVAAQGRGVMFIKPGVKVYEGMIVGQNSRATDIDVNVCKEKKLSNMRAVGDGAAEGLHSPRDLSLEEAVEYLGDDELLEVTPKSLRLRKMYLTKNERKRAKKRT